VSWRLSGYFSSLKFVFQKKLQKTRQKFAFWRKNLVAFSIPQFIWGQKAHQFAFIYMFQVKQRVNLI